MLNSLTSDRFNKETGEWKHLDDKSDRGEGMWLNKISYDSGKFEVRQESNVVACKEVGVSLQTLLAEAESVFRDATKQASIRVKFIYRVTIKVSGCDKPPIDIKTKVPFYYEAHLLKHNLCFVVNGRFDTT